MTKDLYDKYYNDPDVVKLGECMGAYFQSSDGKFAAFFMFMHFGFPNKHIEGDKRIILSISPFDSFSSLFREKSMMKVEREKIILTNSNRPDYAISYRLEIDEDKECTKVTLLDKPRLGEVLITKEEIDGIQKIIVES